ncbi:FecR family protein [Pedobacter immunditicola]|uniref:FecR family protein n=1 Tax=Pedobacter immunditicola TaxID=3133440 RepID=UPI0030B757F5
MEITKELILKFFKNKCTAEEAVAVAHYLKLQPELLEDFLPEQTWNELKEEEESLLAQDKKEALLMQVKHKLGLPMAKTPSLWWMSAAASLLIIFGLTLWLYQKPAALQSPVKDVVHNLVKMNYGKEELVLKISDGSTVLLKPGSELRYPEKFKGNERNFYLNGAARFKVAKDVSRPFKVHAGETITTALGTDFTIINHKDDDHILINLHEGLVVIGPGDIKKAGEMKPIYLKPGEQLTVNKNTLTSRLANTNIGNIKKIIKVQRSTTFSASTISFKNQSLENIFNSLNQELSTNIHFKAIDLSGRYFTGNFKRDSLAAEKILKEIALLNNLTIDKNDQHYYLSLKTNTKENQPTISNQP